jgi:branched-chain amino acid transport system substrate-binding protein
VAAEIGDRQHRVADEGLEVTAHKARTGRDLDDTGGRWMQACFVLADAISRAGATDPAKIQKALQETDLPSQPLMTGYRGVTVDEAGQNALASTYLLQLQGLDYKAVRPAARATRAAGLTDGGMEVAAALDLS